MSGAGGRLIRVAAALTIAAGGALVAGCAPEGLSRRYLAEEGFWDAERFRDAFGGRRMIPTARPEIEKRYARILSRFPATPSDRAGASPCLATVNGFRGLARLALGHSALEAGRPAAAEGAFRELLAEAPSQSPLSVEARLGIAKAAEWREDARTAFALYESLLAELSPGRGLDARSLSSFFPIPLYLAERRAGLGDPAGAESSLALGERIIAAFRAASEDSSVRSVAGVWLTEVLLARRAATRAASLIEERAREASTRTPSVPATLLLFAARLRFDSGDAVRARTLATEARAGVGSEVVWFAADRLEGEILLAERERAAGVAELSRVLESGTGLEEEAAQAGVTLAEYAASRGDWGGAVEAYGRVEVRYPLTEARVEASVQRARILDERLDAEGGAREVAARELLAMARLRPGIRRSELAEDGAALLLEGSGKWTDLLALLEEIAKGVEGRERAAAALVHAAAVCREQLREPERADAYLIRTRREFSGTLGALQAALMLTPERPKNGQHGP